MGYKVSVKVFEDRSEVVFVKLAESIYHVKKDRFGELDKYVDNVMILRALNANAKVLILSESGNLIHKNF